MKVVIRDNSADVAAHGARVFRQQLARKADSVLGLATGSTPVLLYERLVSLYRAGDISFRQVTTFNLDEYLGLDADHPQSYRHFMDEQLFAHVDIDRSRTFLPGSAPDVARQTGRDYEARILAAGGIDLQLLGIGRNGHIGFNEPFSSLASRTRVKTLTARTIADNARFFAAGDYQPHLAITMGIGTILDARQVLLLATGADKASAIAAAIEGPVTARCPASALQLHRTVTLVLDAAAASGLSDPEFFRHIEREDEALAEQD
jgi:glucosamine-6-phosphate deaminase